MCTQHHNNASHALGKREGKKGGYDAAAHIEQNASKHSTTPNYYAQQTRHNTQHHTRLVRPPVCRPSPPSCWVLSSYHGPSNHSTSANSSRLIPPRVKGRPFPGNSTPPSSSYTDPSTFKVAKHIPAACMDRFLIKKKRRRECPIDMGNYKFHYPTTQHSAATGNPVLVTSARRHTLFSGSAPTQGAASVCAARKMCHTTLAARQSWCI